ncbi:hypothetical protein ACHAXT_013096 [Thalassiosira profunda]
MGGSLSTVRWTPVGPLPNAHHQRPLLKSKSYPPTSPSSSTTNLTYEHDSETEEEFAGEHGHGHAGTSGILMGANAPPLYDACLVGRWDEALAICGVEEASPEGSGDSPATATTKGSTSVGGSNAKDGPAVGAEATDAGGSTLDDTTNGEAAGVASGHPRLQTRYADRRRNTPLHLACRRQPPPSVVRAILKCSPTGAASRRTADGLTPLHFAAYCGAGEEVVEMLVERMADDAAVGRAAKSTSAMTLEETENETGGEHAGKKDGGERPPSPSEGAPADPPPTRLLDRRRRTPLHCALSGFRTFLRPAVVRTLLAVDPAAAALGDERGRTPLSLLFDDYAEEVVEALEGDVSPSMVRGRIKEGGELNECWALLELLLRAAYRGDVPGEGEDRSVPEQGRQGSIGESNEERQAPQARLDARESEHFSIVHAAAGVWECPAPLAQLVLKCTRPDASDDFRPAIEEDAVSGIADEGEEIDPLRQPDETGRLPLHVAVCSRPEEGKEGGAPARVRSDAGSIITHPDRGRSVGRRGSADAGRVYNPRFGRSPSRDSAAYSHSGWAHSSVTDPTGREPIQHSMVRDVLALYPAAAATVDPHTGQLPVVLAVEHGHSWDSAAGPLLNAYPAPFGGNGDGGMALPDGSAAAKAHREALEGALLRATGSLEPRVRIEAARTAGRLAGWGGAWGANGSLDGLVEGWLGRLRLDAMTSNADTGNNESPRDILVDPGTNLEVEWRRTQAAHLTAVAEVVARARPEAVSDRVARSCLAVGREYLFSNEIGVREAAARVLGNTLDSIGDADDACNVMRELVLNIADEEGSACGSVKSTKSGRGEKRREDLASRHGRLAACRAILATRWGSHLLEASDIADATLTLIHRRVKDRSPEVRAAAYAAVGPLLGRGPPSTLKDLRGDILKGTRASELAEVQVSLAQGLTFAARLAPELFLCRAGMPILDGALMLAMSRSTARPDVRRAFRIFLWAALQMGRSGDGEEATDDEESTRADSRTDEGRPGALSPGLEKYMALAEGENGQIMLKFVAGVRAKMDELADDSGSLCR